MIALVIVFAATAVVALAIATWGGVQCLRMNGALLKAHAGWMADVADFESKMQVSVSRRVSFYNQQIRAALENAGYQVPESFTSAPAGEAPPDPKVRTEPTMARQTGRLDEVHEKNRELTRKREEGAEFPARDAVSFQDQGVEVG
jgi:hypothetical protein